MRSSEPLVSAVEATSWAGASARFVGTVRAITKIIIYAVDRELSSSIALNVLSFVGMACFNRAVSV